MLVTELEFKKISVGQSNGSNLIIKLLIGINANFCIWILKNQLQRYNMGKSQLHFKC